MVRPRQGVGDWVVSFALAADAGIAAVIGLAIRPVGFQPGFKQRGQGVSLHLARRYHLHCHRKFGIQRLLMGTGQRRAISRRICLLTNLGHLGFF